MQRTDIALEMGAGITYTKWTITSADLTTAGLTQNINLLENPPSPGAVTITPNVNFIIPQGGAVMGVKIKHTVAFAGGTIASMTVSVGRAGNNAMFASAFDVFQAVSDTALQETALFKSGQGSSVPVTVTFTSTVGNLTAATAGSVDIYLLYLDVSTSSAPSTTPGQTGGGAGV